MASSYNADLLAEYSLNLLRGQMFSQLTGMSLNGWSLADFVLGRPPKRSGTDIMNDAVSGLMRSDAALLRQGSKNMAQGKALLESGAAALESIAGKAARMKEIVDSVDPSLAGTATLDALKAEYLSLASAVKGVIEGTSFNGLRILDGAAWSGRDGDISPAGGTGKISLSAGGAPSDLTLFDLQNYKDMFANSADADFGALSGVLPGPTDIRNTLANFVSLLGDMGASYKARAGLLENEGQSLERRASILDEATGKAAPGDEAALRQALLDILLREQGALLETVT